MPQIPRDKKFDSSLDLLNEGYNFIRNRCEQLESDIFETRLMLQKAICMKGEEAARLFYDNERFKRKGAAPLLVKSTLFGFGGVQGLDGGDHWNRKQMFMSLMTGRNIHQLYALMNEKWREYAREWEREEQVVLFNELQKMLCEVICSWTGVPLPESDVALRARQLGDLIEAPGSVGSRFWRGRKSRRQTEQWIKSLIEKVRKNELEVPEDKALAVVAHHETREEELLDARVAAVELLNILRPTVAVARYIVFAAMALHDHPEMVEKLRKDEDGAYLDLFTREVRRFYPFFPLVAARVRKGFEWKGYAFPKSTRVVLDLYGTNHDENSWTEPEQFQPERFCEWEDNDYNFIPQGGGDHHKNHRCPGEFTTVDLIKTGVRFLVKPLRYNVPPQDLRIDLARMPAIPKSRFIIDKVWLRDEAKSSSSVDQE